MATSSTTLSIRDRLDRRLPVRARPNRDPTLTILCAGTVASLASALTAMAMARLRGPRRPAAAQRHQPLAARRAGGTGPRAHRPGERGRPRHPPHLRPVLGGALQPVADREPDRSTGEIVGGAAATAALAACVDYGTMPRRLTPGWELSLSPRGVGVTFVGLALGLAGGALLARALR